MTISHRKDNDQPGYFISTFYDPVRSVWLSDVCLLESRDSLYSSDMSFIPKTPWRTIADYLPKLWPLHKNTLKVAVASVTTVILVTFTAYAFSGSFMEKTGLIAMLVLQMFPGIMNMVAMYVLLNLWLADTHLGLIIVMLVHPHNTWLMKVTWMDIPFVEEAAITTGK